ncbi:hypothetical protein FHS85_000763 [Rhodoligotrophos appendicifer]|uniref:GNAT family N-acetyltransferase n=1 Tax=Rhodoligotrophos appendicifer TaxID=987056 RepID=UPI001479760F|nr:GNAT family N-acetyltransferase [Rhodoligotrophos appendicifer]
MALIGGEEQPLGVLPLSPLITAPVPVYALTSVWRHRHCFESTPIIREGEEAKFLAALFRDLRRNGVKLFHWPSLALDTAFAEELLQHVRRNGFACQVIQRVDRPLLIAEDQCPDTFMSSVLSKKRLRELRRCRRRLDELGQVRFRVFEGVHDAGEWCQDFLALEASGWKGASGTGTALSCRPEDRAYFEALASGSAARGAALVHSLELDGRPVAMTVNYRDGGRVWAFKTAYDDRLAHLSPGVLVEIEGTRAALRDPNIAWIDACTDGNPGLMNELWPDRRPVVDLLIATSSTSNALVRPVTKIIRSIRRLRSGAGELRRRMRRRGHRSRGGPT